MLFETLSLGTALVLVRPEAEFHRWPGDPAPVTFAGDGTTLDAAWVVERLEAADGWVSVRSTESTVGTCAPILRRYPDYDLVFWVRSEDLVPALAEPWSWSTADGGAVRVEPGVPVYDLGDGTARIGIPGVDLVVPTGGLRLVDHVAPALPPLTVDEARVPAGAHLLLGDAALPVHAELPIARLPDGRVRYDARCVTIESRATDVVPLPPPRPSICAQLPPCAIVPAVNLAIAASTPLSWPDGHPAGRTRVAVTWRDWRQSGRWACTELPGSPTSMDLCVERSRVMEVATTRCR